MSPKDTGSDDLGALVRDLKTTSSPFRTYLQELHKRHLPEKGGAVADYIPELARVDPDQFAISVVTADGTTFSVGHDKQEFTIQSASKPFVFGLALETHGRAYVNSKVGVEPTGDAFNSIIKLDEASKRPYNPMVNAGAIATAALVAGKDAPEKLKNLLDTFGRYCGREMQVDMSVFTSERSTGHRNRAMAHLMLNFGMVPANIEEFLDLYFQQCSIRVTSVDLAMIGATLANGGVNPRTKVRAIESEFVRDLLSVMFTCGMYDYSGEWVYRVGIPAKSGVGGGIVGVVPGKLGIGVFSPRLDAKGNSVRGIKVFEELAETLGLHQFDVVEKSPELWQALAVGK